MPKKRSSYWSRSKKEKQIITARLIEISMKIEDCIYKNKPILVCEAEQYMMEVSSYKTLCSRDERSLQVIEKLTRCMKTIISDHQELRSDKHTINNESSIADIARAGSISPVYSIPDEDRTQFSQIAEAGPVNVPEDNKDIEIIDLSNIDDDDDLMHNRADTATANHASSKITIEVDIHRAMSSLSLKDVGDQVKNSTDVNDSQSILEHYGGVDEVPQNEMNIVSQGAVGGELVGYVTDKERNEMEAREKNLNNTSTHERTTGLVIKPDEKSKMNSALKKPYIDVCSKNNAKYLIFVPKPLEVINTSNYTLTDTYQKNNTISSKTFYPVTNNIPESQRQTWYDSNRTCTKSDARHTQLLPSIAVETAANFNIKVPTNTLNKVEKEKPPMTNIGTSKALNNTDIVKEISTKKKRCPRKKKVVDENEIKPKNKRVNRIPKNNKENSLTKSAKNKSIPIYNENVVNDLSWVENIRFVREIGIDENDPKLNLEDSFWDNYYLPANWSENEFM